MSRLATRVNKLFEKKKRAWWDAWEAFGNRWGQLIPIKAHKQLTPENADRLMAFASECREQGEAGEATWLSLWEGTRGGEYNESLELIVGYEDSLPFSEHDIPFPLMPTAIKDCAAPPDIPDGLEDALLEILDTREGNVATLAAMCLRTIAFVRTVKEYQAWAGWQID